MPLKTPFAVMVATVAGLTLHVTVLTVALSGAMVAVRLANGESFVTASTSEVTVMPVTKIVSVITTISTLSFKLVLSVVSAYTFIVPPETPVTKPVLETVAIVLSLVEYKISEETLSGPTVTAV